MHARARAHTRTPSDGGPPLTDDGRRGACVLASVTGVCGGDVRVGGSGGGGEERVRAPPEVYPCRDLTSCRRFRSSSAAAAADTFRQHYMAHTATATTRYRTFVHAHEHARRSHDTRRVVRNDNRTVRRSPCHAALPTRTIIFYFPKYLNRTQRILLRTEESLCIPTVGQHVWFFFPIVGRTISVFSNNRIKDIFRGGEFVLRTSYITNCTVYE